MFSASVGDKEYKVLFRHNNPVTVGIDDLIFGDRNPGTDCFIKNGDGVVGEGHTKLHPVDMYKYHKNEGRRRSMDRALQHAFSGAENKELRRLFWITYYNARGGKW